MLFVNNSNSGDPSDSKQVLFPDHLQIWCCRYWQLTSWECNNMSFPYWRLYWNKTSRGQIMFGETRFEMDSDCVYIIPPYTSFNTHIKDHQPIPIGINVIGKQIDKTENEEILGKDHLLHLFIHFNLGIPFDRALPGIFRIEIDEQQKSRLEKITDFLKTQNGRTTQKEIRKNAAIRQESVLKA